MSTVEEQVLSLMMVEVQAASKAEV